MGLKLGKNMGQFYMKTQVDFIVSGDTIPHKSFFDIDLYWTGKVSMCYLCTTICFLTPKRVAAKNGSAVILCHLQQ